MSAVLSYLTADRREIPSEAASPVEAAVSVFRLLEEFSLFSCPEEDADDAPL